MTEMGRKHWSDPVKVANPNKPQTCIFYTFLTGLFPANLFIVEHSNAVTYSPWALCRRSKYFFVSKFHLPQFECCFLAQEDVVAPVLFLLSEDAAMINGHNLPIDGGFLATGLPLVKQ